MQHPRIELPKPKRPDHDFVRLIYGSVVNIAGVDCRLAFVNRGKRRMTFIPVSETQTMPIEQAKGGPVIRAHPRGESPAPVLHSTQNSKPKEG